MTHKLIIDCSTNEIIEKSFTEEEKQQQLEQQKKEDIKYTVVEEKPTQEEVKLAEYVLELEDWKEKVSQKLNELGGNV